jgi:transglutaminase-like putative cysteine protease
VAGLGLFVFVLCPRQGNSQWNTTTLSQEELPQTGFSQMIDLNHSGQLQLDSRVAFKVYATDADGKPKLDLSREQHWRGLTMPFYAKGRWLPGRTPIVGRDARAREVFNPYKPPRGAPPVPAATDEERRRLLPSLGDHQFFLTFALDFSIDLDPSEGLFLAEPVILNEQKTPPLPVISLVRNSRWAPIFFDLDTTLLPPPRGTPPDKISYQQVAAPSDGMVLPAMGITPTYRLHLAKQPVPGITRWTRDLVQRLAAKSQVTQEDLEMTEDPAEEPSLRLLPQNREKVARALNRYLLSSGDYSYSLASRRSEPRMDATEDFLCNSKQGHCEHFAAALALMLRSLGVPCRIVSGFRGAESQAEGDDGPGWYIVRQSNAHVWVEALIERSGANGKSQELWLPLDPTPLYMDTSDSLWTKWWSDARGATEDLWSMWVINYSTAQQGEALAGLKDFLVPGSQEEASGTRSGRGIVIWGGLLTLLALAGVFFFRWVVRRERKRVAHVHAEAPVSPVAFYRRLLAIVAQHLKMMPARAQTAQEFAAAVGTTLHNTPAAVGLTAVPLQVVRHYYQVRFGARELSETDSREVERRLDDLDNALKPPRS